MRSSLRPVAAALALAFLPACGSDSGSSDNGSSPSGSVPFDARPILANLGDNVIVPTYRDLRDVSADLGVKVAGLNDGNPTETDLNGAQAAWKATRVPWETSEGFLFGPVSAQGIDPLIDTWPLATSDLRAFLNAGRTRPQDILAASENVQGFHAIEFLLFGNGVDRNDQPVSSLQPEEIDYLDSLTEVLEGHTRDLYEAWTVQYDPTRPASGPYVSQFKNPQAGGIYTSQGAVVEELINGIVGIIDEVGNGKMTEPLGSSLANADTSLVESQYSWNSLTDFHNNIQSTLNIYSGVRGFDPHSQTISASANGLYSFVAAHDRALADQVLNAIVAGYDDIALIDGDGRVDTTDIRSADQIPFRQAIKNEAGRQRIQTAIQALQSAQDLIKSRVRPLLGQTQFSQ